MPLQKKVFHSFFLSLYTIFKCPFPKSNVATCYNFGILGGKEWKDLKTCLTKSVKLPRAKKFFFFGEFCIINRIFLVSCITCHGWHVTCHLSHVTYHLSHITYHISCVTKGNTNGEASLWNVCYQWGLTCLVYRLDGVGPVDNRHYTN